jgi:hypothetical protein
MYTCICCVPRNGLGKSHDVPLAVLKKAEKADFTDGILIIRKAGDAFTKKFTKDSLVGLKNPIRRSRKLLQTEAIVTNIGPELAKDATEALAAYDEAISELEDLGKKAQSWITETVIEGINEMLIAGDKVLQMVDAVFQTLGSMDASLSLQSKEKQATSRKTRMDARKVLKIFELAGIPNLWRLALHDAGLSIDTEDALHDPDKNFENYKASAPTFTEEFLKGSDSWDVPKWYAPNDTGPYVDLVQ